MSASVLRVRACVGCIAVLGASVLVGAETELRVRSDVGFDTNPLRMSGDGPDAAFAQLMLGGHVRFELAPRTKWFVEGRARQRWHASGQAEADSTRADVSTGLAFSALPVGKTRVSLSLGVGHNRQRSTYTDPVTGQVALIQVTPATLPPSYVAIPDRFDNDATRAFVETRWRLSKRFLVLLDLDRGITDFTDDSTGSAGLESLDHRSLTIEPGLMVKASAKLTVGLTLVRTELDYDEQSAADASGARVPGVLREYRDSEARITLYLSPAEGWKLRLGLGEADRRDAYAGYYGYGSTTGFMSLDRRFGSNGLQFSASRRDLEYDRAVVSGGTEAELRASEVWSFLGRFERKLHRQVRWFSEAGTQRVDSRDTEYAYDRDWLMTGFEYRR